MRTVGQHITKLVDKRLEESADGAGKQYVRESLLLVSVMGPTVTANDSNSQVDITQFVITTSRTPRQRDPRRMVQLIAAMLFAVSLAVPMVRPVLCKAKQMRLTNSCKDSLLGNHQSLHSQRVY